jgi:BirA family biotin operon repressor/biotin-[acetyl-CoA-carboxylase] ligase
MTAAPKVPRGVCGDLEPLAARIAERGMTLGVPLELMAETDSTNDVAKRAAKNGAPHGATFVAEAQSRGRGRQGRSWFGSPGESLLFSVLLRIPVQPARLPPLALVAGLAVRDAVARAAPQAEVKIKWPNDVLARAAASEPYRKVAGVLVEATLASGAATVVMGIGLNVHTRAFPDEIAALATSVALVAQPGAEPIDRAALLADILQGLDRDVAHVAARGLGLVHARLRAADALFGSPVTTEDVRGVAEGIELDGRLRVRKDDGTLVRVASGEARTA